MFYDALTNKVFRVYDRDKGIVERVSDVRIEDKDMNCKCVFIPDPVYSSARTLDADKQENEKEDPVTSDDSDTEREEQEEDDGEKGRTEKSDRREEEIFHEAESELPKQSVVVQNKPKPTVGTSSYHLRIRPPTKPIANQTQPASKSTYRMHTRTKQQALAAMEKAMHPESVKDALDRDDGEMWKQAMDEEIASQEKNKTWLLVKLPAGRKKVSCKWVFKAKTKPDGTLDRRKARLVARGFSQTEGVDFFETFSPVVRYESVRCVLSLAAERDMTIKQFDVKTAFLYGDLEEEVYMQQPEAYDDGSGKVCKLQKSLYGLKQSSRNWNSKFSEFLKS